MNSVVWKQSSSHIEEKLFLWVSGGIPLWWRHNTWGNFHRFLVNKHLEPTVKQRVWTSASSMSLRNTPLLLQFHSLVRPDYLLPSIILCPIKQGGRSHLQMRAMGLSDYKVGRDKTGLVWAFKPFNSVSACGHVHWRRLRSSRSGVKQNSGLQQKYMSPQCLNHLSCL